MLCSPGSSLSCSGPEIAANSTPDQTVLPVLMTWAFLRVQEESTPPVNQNEGWVLRLLSEATKGQRDWPGLGFLFHRREPGSGGFRRAEAQEMRP